MPPPPPSPVMKRRFSYDASKESLFPSQFSVLDSDDDHRRLSAAGTTNGGRIPSSIRHPPAPPSALDLRRLLRRSVGRSKLQCHRRRSSKKTSFAQLCTKSSLDSYRTLNKIFSPVSVQSTLLLTLFIYNYHFHCLLHNGKSRKLTV